MSNRLANAMSLRPNAEFFSMGRAPAAGRPSGSGKAGDTAASKSAESKTESKSTAATASAALSIKPTDVLLEKVEDGIARITLNRADTLNRLSRSMVRAAS